MLILLKFICLLVAIIYGFSNVAKTMYIIKGGEATVNGVQMFMMALGIVGFVFLQFKLYL